MLIPMLLSITFHPMPLGITYPEKMRGDTSRTFDAVNLASCTPQFRVFKSFSLVSGLVSKNETKCREALFLLRLQRFPQDGELLHG